MSMVVLAAATGADAGSGTTPRFSHARRHAPGRSGLHLDAASCPPPAQSPRRLRRASSPVGLVHTPFTFGLTGRNDLTQV